MTLKEAPVVLLNGTQLGTVCCWCELGEWVQKPILLKKKVMVRVEPHHHLQAMNGHGGIKKFALIGRGIFAPPRPQKEVGIILYKDVQKKNRIAIIPRDFITEFPGEKEPLPWGN